MRGAGAGGRRVNGALIVKARASAMIVTLATSMIPTAAWWRCRNNAPRQRTGVLARAGAAAFAGHPRTGVGVAGRAAAGRAATACGTVFGRYLDDGRQPQAAALIGHSTCAVIFLSHVASALISVLCGFILVGFNGKGSITLGQDLAR